MWKKLRSLCTSVRTRELRSPPRPTLPHRPPKAVAPALLGAPPRRSSHPCQLLPLGNDNDLDVRRSMGMAPFHQPWQRASCAPHPHGLLPGHPALQFTVPQRAEWWKLQGATFRRDNNCLLSTSFFPRVLLWHSATWHNQSLRGGP